MMGTSQQLALQYNLSFKTTLVCQFFWMMIRAKAIYYFVIYYCKIVYILNMKQRYV